MWQGYDESVRNKGVWSSCASTLSALALLFALALPASAHAEFLDSNPAVDSHLTVLPSRIMLHFGENLSDLAGANAIVVTGPDGVEVTEDLAQVEGARVSRAMKPGTMLGAYRVLYRVLSEDGHPVKGNFDFFLDASRSDPAPHGFANAGERTEQKSFLAVHSTHVSIALLVLLTVGIWFGFENLARKRRDRK